MACWTTKASTRTYRNGASVDFSRFLSRAKIRLVAYYCLNVTEKSVCSRCTAPSQSFTKSTSQINPDIETHITRKVPKEILKVPPWSFISLKGAPIGLICMEERHQFFNKASGVKFGPKEVGKLPRDIGLNMCFVADPLGIIREVSVSPDFTRLCLGLYGFESWSKAK